MSDTEAQEKSAQRRIAEFERRYGQAALRLARYAALPVAITPEFLHLLRINFFLDPPNALPYEAEAEMLFSSLCREVGECLYEIGSDSRALLLQQLAQQETDERLKEIAALIWLYSQFEGVWRGRVSLERAQQINALTFLEPETANAWLDETEKKASAGERIDRSWLIAVRRERDWIQQKTSSVQLLQEFASQPASVPTQQAQFSSRPSLRAARSEGERRERDCTNIPRPFSISSASDPSRQEEYNALLNAIIWHIQPPEVYELQSIASRILQAIKETRYPRGSL